MCQDSLHFFFVHAGKKTCGNSHHGRILCCAGCESIGFAFIDTDFRHRDTGFLRVMVNGVNEPSLEFGARMIDVNHLHAHRRFGNRLAHEQRDDGTAETDNPRKYQKCPIALAFPGNVREVDSENGRNNVENNSEYNQTATLVRRNKPILLNISTDQSLDKCCYFISNYQFIACCHAPQNLDEIVSNYADASEHVTFLKGFPDGPAGRFPTDDIRGISTGIYGSQSRILCTCNEPLY